MTTEEFSRNVGMLFSELRWPSLHLALALASEIGGDRASVWLKSTERLFVKMFGWFVIYCISKYHTWADDLIPISCAFGLGMSHKSSVCMHVDKSHLHVAGFLSHPSDRQIETWLPSQASLPGSQCESEALKIRMGELQFGNVIQSTHSLWNVSASPSQTSRLFLPF